MDNQDQSESTDISLGTVCSLGSNPYRLTLIRVLATQSRELTLNDLTKEIVVHETDKDLRDKSGDELTQIRNLLYHKHIPRLVEADAVTYDSERKIIEPTEKLEIIHSWLESIQNNETEP